MFNVKDKKHNVNINIKILHPITNEVNMKGISVNENSNILSSNDDNLYLAKLNAKLPQPHLIEISNDAISSKQYGVLIPISSELYGILKIDSKPKESEAVEPYFDISKPSDLISKCASLKITDNTPLKFSMDPPNKEIDDPESFINLKYYHTLYLLKTPLNYFPKTCLIRFKNMTSSKEDQIDILKELILTIDGFDKRHEGILKKTDSINEYESEQIDLFMQKYDIKLKDGILEIPNPQLLTDLKIREGQLQIILILEYLSLMNKNENEFLSENRTKYEKHLKKLEKQQFKHLIKKKDKKKDKEKIVPTFLGTGSFQIDIKPPSDFNFALYMFMNNLIDRLSLWDTLSKRNHTYEYMGYVLVPYYNKRLPVLTKYLVDSMKDSNMKLTTSKRKKDHEEEDAETTTDSKSSNGKYKKMLLNKPPPVLKKSTSLSEEYQSKIPSLKKSKSNLSSKNLSKRQIDLNLKESSKKEVEVSFVDSQNIFTQAKRSKSMKNILSTPSKPKSYSQIESTPQKSKPMIKSKSFSQIEATPQHDRFIKPSSSNKKIEIEATPVKRNTAIINSTPNQLINSSPTKKPKPGDPIQSSPFYSILTDDDNDNDYDSDEIKPRKLEIK
ncbi:unnamed protein product [Candida verbasci]|uniref:DNA replication regulator Sld3 C-terminal domain-containing protein n=1 Tax=Candida verbasci TaxID=1227364 RepID=A0A9W4TTR2_9ASCO|nr:unnamed protein product [Candida verbasci]